jgi:hypothetical protein
MPGDDLTHGPPATKNAGGRYHRFGRINRHSLRNGVNGLYRARPGETDFRVTVTSEIALAGLAPATGAPGPHALARPLPCRTPCGTLASIAFHPAFVAIATRPSIGMERDQYS